MARRPVEFARSRALAHAIATAPGLGAFATAVGVLGLDGAVELCATREPTTRLAHVWDALGYGLAQLPTAEEIRLIEVGAEVMRRHIVKRKLPEGKAPLASLVSDGLCSVADARKAIKLLESYGATVEPLREEVAAL